MTETARALREAGPSPAPTTKFLGTPDERVPLVMLRSTAVFAATIVLCVVAFAFVLPGIPLSGWLVILVVLLVLLVGAQVVSCLSRVWNVALDSLTVTFGYWRRKQTFAWTSYRSARKIHVSKGKGGTSYTWLLEFRDPAGPGAARVRVPMEWGEAIINQAQMGPDWQERIRQLGTLAGSSGDRLP